MFRPTVCFIVLVLGIALQGCKTRVAPPSTSASSNPAPVGRQTFGDFSIEVPDNWIIEPPERGKTKVTLLLGASRWDLAKAMIKVDVGSPKLPTAQAMAQVIAEGPGDRIAKDTVDVDGEKGIKVTTSSNNLDRPRIVVVVFRHEKMYLLMGASVEAADAIGAVEGIRKSWKWTK